MYNEKPIESAYQYAIKSAHDSNETFFNTFSKCMRI